MPSVYDLKPKFQSLLRPLVRTLARKGVTANQVTIAALVLSIITGLLVYLFGNSSWVFVMIPVVLFIRMAMNAIDGMLAREFHMASKLGAILNELTDVLSDIALYLPFIVLGMNFPELILLFVFLAVISEMTGVIAIQIGATRRYDGPMGKSDRAFVMSVISIVLFMGTEQGVWLDIVFVILNLLLVVTIYNRAKKALAESK